MLPHADPEKKAASKPIDSADPLKKMAASEATSKASYSVDPEKKKAASEAASKTSYIADLEKKMAASKPIYSADPSNWKLLIKLAIVLAPDKAGCLKAMPF